MHLAFIDIAQAYKADRPDQDAAFGGTNTAVCFLARELVKAGVECTFFNRVERPETACGITSLPLDALIEAREERSYSAFIFCGRWVEWMVKLVREKAKAPLIIWMHESTFGAALNPPLDVFDGIVFVSDWQARVNQTFVPQHWRQAVIRNAINPAFANMFTYAPSIRGMKAEPPVLIYAGATPRGVLYMPLLLEQLRKLRDDFSVEIYSSVAPTHDPAINATCLAEMKKVPGVTHVGPVGQQELARRMARASILVSPNPWPETSCITLMEALAAGLLAVTTDRAALPETAAGFARHIPITDVDHLSRFDMPMPTEKFAEAIAECLGEMDRSGTALEDKLRKQTEYFNAHYQWASRAIDWIKLVESLTNDAHGLRR